MVTRIGLAVVVGVATALLVLFLGLILVATGIPLAKTAGGFLEQWCWIFGLLVGAWFFFTGRTSLNL